MTPYRHVVTHGTGVFVRQHSIPGFLERYDSNAYMSPSQIHSVFTGFMNNDQNAGDMFYIPFNSSIPGTTQEPIIRTSFSRLAIATERSISIKDYGSPMSYREAVDEMDIDEDHEWVIFICRSMRYRDMSQHTIHIVTRDIHATIDDPIPPWDGRTFRMVMALPKASHYAIIQFSGSQHQHAWVIVPTDETCTVSREDAMNAFRPLLVPDDTQDFSYVIRHLYRYDSMRGQDSALFRMVCDMTVLHNWSRYEDRVERSHIRSRDFDTSGILTTDEMYQKAVTTTHSFTTLARTLSTKRYAFVSFLMDCASTITDNDTQRFKMYLRDDCEVYISYYINEQCLQPEGASTRWTRDRIQHIIPFVCHWSSRDSCLIDDVLEATQRVDILIPCYFSERPCTVQTRMLANLSDRDMVHPESYDDQGDMVTRAIRAINNSDVLYEYQKENVRWMIAQEHAKDGMVGVMSRRVTGQPGGEGLFRRTFPDTSYTYVTNPDGVFTSGGFLCDDVGMGKTRQIIELVRATTTDDTKATLIVVPPNVIDQWRLEIDTVWTSCRLAIFHGRNKRHVNTHALHDYDIVLTTPRMESTLPETAWERIAIDESHIVKRIWRGHTAKKKWMITATPYSNLSDQIQWLYGKNVHVFYDLSYDSSSTQVSDFKWPRDPVVCMKRQHAFLSVLMTRKTRSVHALLPQVTNSTVNITISEDDMSHYSSVIAQMLDQHVYSNYINVMNAASTLTSAATFGKRYIPTPVRSRCSHMRDDTSVDPDDVPQDELCPICITVIGSDAVVTPCKHWFCDECLAMCIQTQRERHSWSHVTCPMCRQPIPSNSVIRAAVVENIQETTSSEGTNNETYISTKMERLLGDIQERQRDDKSILIFCTSKEHATYVSSVCKDSGILHSVVHGSMPVERRNRIFSSFQERSSPESRVVIATTKCASAGLNLTRADTIFLLSPVDDASIEEQIIGRARRIGRAPDQDIEFVVYIANDTIEEDIHLERQTHRVANVWDITRGIIDTTYAAIRSST